MATPQPIQIGSRPGISRDGTAFENESYIDGQWCRFTARGKPKKMAGYQAVTSHLTEIIRSMDAYVYGATNYLHLGSASFLTQVQVDLQGNLGSQSDRTPAGFAASSNNLWQFDIFVNVVSASVRPLVAHAAPNLTDIGSTVETPIYYGNVNGVTPLIPTAMDPVSGGIVALPPYLIAYSNGGRVDVSSLNSLTVPPSAAFVTGQKIVKGLALRNGGGGPAGLLWSLDSLIVMTYNPNLLAGIPFNFNTISDDISVLSSQGIVEFDGIYYWAAVDRFSMFNGVVQELPNNMNVDYFFDNLNFAARQKVFAFKVPRWGEIWWCAPLFGASECNHAVIYNTRLRTWYDTPLPDGGRSAGIFAKVFHRPFMCDVDQQSTGYTLWQHEKGLDKILGVNTYPIDSYFQTHEISPITLPQPVDKAFRVSIIEPDFNQSGPLNITVYGRANARATQTPSTTISIPAVATGASDQVADFKTNGRLMSFRFESNTPGGDYRMGRPMAHVEPTDGRLTG